MPYGKKVCKICGKEYDYCKTKATGLFIWRDVACCEEHASEYFKLIAESRGDVAATPSNKVEYKIEDKEDIEVVYDIEDDIDEYVDEEVYESPKMSKYKFKFSGK